MKLKRTRGLDLLAALSVAFIVGCGGGGGGPSSEVSTVTDTSSFTPSMPVSDWRLVWSDEFDGSQVDTKKWNFEVNCAGGGNQERQCYTDSAENAFIENGIFNIVALPAEEGAEKPYTSARVTTEGKGDFKYGRFEIRAKMPTGQGSWPAIWMMPTDAVYGDWPRSGEVDIVEAVNLKAATSDGGEEKHVYGTLHYGKIDANGRDASSGKAYALPNGANPADDFHTYALEWDEGEMRWYVDDYLYATQRKSDVVTNSKGQAVGLRHKGWFAEYYDPATGEETVTYTNAPFDQEFFLIMNLAVGGNWPESVNATGVDETAFAQGQSFQIDWVRVYECSMNPETGKGCETVRAGYDMSEDDHPTGALVEGAAPVPAIPTGPTLENLTIFGGTANPNWAAWDCCGGSTPGLVEDVDRGNVFQFEIGAAPTVVGFISRGEFLGDDGTPTPFDATAMAASGTVSFDMKVVTPPNDANSTWLMKIESDNAATAAEVALTTSQEGVAPVAGQWQTYTFALADLQTAGLDLSAIDVIMVFPAWGTGEGAVFQLDNVEISSPLAASPSLDVFVDAENASWPLWDCCGGSTPAVVVDEDSSHGASAEFSIGAAPTVMGFISRSDNTDVPAPFDATTILADGVIQFDVKVITAPNDATAAWLFKVESNNAATAAELNLTASVEGAAPAVGEWRTFTFKISDLVAAGLDASAIDVLMVFPAWGAGEGAVYRVDNVRIYDPTASGSVAFNGHVLFKDGALDAWPLWDCCGGSTPTVVADDIHHGAVAQFEVGAAPTVLGINSRSDFTDTPSPIDASALLADGVVQFEMKVVTAPNDASSTWLFKIESANAATAVELALSASQEGAAPVVGEWQTYTYSLQDLSSRGLDISAIDVLMVFPAWGTGEGAVYHLDNVMIYDPDTLPTRKGITIFENGQGSWSLWDCCGGSTPTVEVDDPSHGTVAEFVVGSAPTVLGFNTRAEFSDSPEPYDASGLLAEGYLRFEMKVVTPPNDASSTWLMKIESANAATAVELALTASQEGAAPVVGEWQTYTYSLQDLSSEGLDISALDVVMVFPAWGTGEGAVYRIDNVLISSP